MLHLCAMMIILFFVIRCFDEIFLTWNNSIEEFDTVLRTINQQHPYIYINVSINDQINYLDVIVGRDHHDNLKIQIAHDLNVEPYALPYLFGHSPNKYQTMLRMALLRAVRCYANVSDFANELLGLQLSFLHNRFSNNFIQNKIVSFLVEFKIPHLKMYSGNKFDNQQLYNCLRQRVCKYQRRQTTAKKKRYRQILKCQWKHSFNSPAHCKMMTRSID